MALLEISDLLVDVDPDTLVRRPVRRGAVVEMLQAAGDRRGAAIAARLPSREDDVLEPAAVDALLVRVHTELQRLTEELQHHRRVTALLCPLIEAWRESGVPGPVRVVDVGCGLGYTLRALASTGALGDAELLGVDLNPALVDAAQDLADREGLDCRFVHGEAARTLGTDDEVARTVFVSTGLLHHLDPVTIESMMRSHAARGALASCHWDIAPTALTVPGAWVFHRARMREPLSRHDGVVSARRAHSDRTLTNAATRAVADVDDRYSAFLHDPSCLHTSVLRVLRPVLVVRGDLAPAFTERVGGHSDRLERVS